MKDLKFFICKHCGNLIEMISPSGVSVVCCGEPMTELKPNTVEASVEKHLPVVKVEGDTVRAEIGSAPHPMTEQHYIQWISLLTDAGTQRKWLKPGDEPKAEFALSGEKAVAVYGYCNLHGLWKTEL